MKRIYRNGFGIRKQTIALEFQAGTDISDAIDYASELAKGRNVRVTFTFNDVSFDTDNERTELEMWKVWNTVTEARGTA